MESIGTPVRIAPIARSPLDSARGRRRRHTRYNTMPLIPPTSNSCEAIQVK
jgi:hypothetical protein